MSDAIVDVETGKFPGWWRRNAIGLGTSLLSLGAMICLAAVAANNLAASGQGFGFGFLEKPAGFRIGETILPYAASDSYGWALIVGLANTIHVALLAAVFATILGVFVGVCRLSSNKPLRQLSVAYVELIRNTPLVLQLVLWHTIILTLPPVRQAVSPITGVFLSQRGLQIPSIKLLPGFVWVAAAWASGVGLAVLNARRSRLRRERTGRGAPLVWQNVALVLGLPALVFLLLGRPAATSWPTLRGFNFAGGVTLSPEYAALLAGLVIYSAAFIGEIVRSSIEAIDRGQWEAGRAIGLGEGRILRLVIFPQAMQRIIPPLTNQYLNLTKNSSLAIVVGYPELASVTNTVINQTGHAIEALSIFMGVYLSISLATAAVMSRFERSITIKSR